MTDELKKKVEQAISNVFFDEYWKFIEWKHNLFDTVDCKKFLEDYFKIDLP